MVARVWTLLVLAATAAAVAVAAGATEDIGEVLFRFDFSAAEALSPERVAPAASVSAALHRAVSARCAVRCVVAPRAAAHVPAQAALGRGPAVRTLIRQWKADPNVMLVQDTPSSPASVAARPRHTCVKITQRGRCEHRRYLAPSEAEGREFARRASPLHSILLTRSNMLHRVNKVPRTRWSPRLRRPVCGRPHNGQAWPRLTRCLPPARIRWSRTRKARRLLSWCARRLPRRGSDLSLVVCDAGREPSRRRRAAGAAEARAALGTEQIR
jgi:hypothetical protein